MKKRLIGILAAAVITTVLLAGCKKEEEETLILGTEAGFPPYEYMEGNEIVGIDIEIAQAIADKMGRKLEIKNMDFDGALLAVQNGTIDILAAGLSISEERDKIMDFSIEYAQADEVVVVKKDAPGVATADDAGLTDKIIGVQQGNTADYYVSDNITAKDIKRYTKFAQASEDLKNGRIDCIIMDDIPAKALVAANPELIILDGVLFQDKYAVAVTEGNAELLKTVNSVLQELKDSGKIDEIKEKHMNID